MESQRQISLYTCEGIVPEDSDSIHSLGSNQGSYKAETGPPCQVVEEAHNVDDSLAVQVDWAGNGLPLLVGFVSTYEFVVLVDLVDPDAVVKAAAWIAVIAVIAGSDAEDAVIERSGSVDDRVLENDSIQSRLYENCWVSD